MNKWKRRGLAVLLSGAMLFSAFPVHGTAEFMAETAGITDQPEEAKQPEKKAPHIVAELSELRGADEKHFRLSDGSMAAAKYPDAVHYATKAGWSEIDNSLSLEKKEEPVYTNRENAFKASFAERADAEELVRLEQDGYALSWSLAREQKKGSALFSAGFRDTASVKAKVMEKEETAPSEQEYIQDEKVEDLVENNQGEQGAETPLPADDPALKVENASSGIVYEDVYPGVDLQYILSGSQLKENLILEKPMDTYTFTLYLQAEGLTAGMTEDGGVAFTPAEGGETVFSIPAPVLYDSKGAVSDAASYTMEETEKGYRLTLTAQEAWMNSPERVYPVTIDPVVLTRRQKAAVASAYAQSGSPNTNAGGFGSIEVGCSSLTSIKNQRGFVKVSMPSIPGNANVIVGARLTLYHFSGSYYDYNGTPTPPGWICIG